jgi:integrase
MTIQPQFANSGQTGITSKNITLADVLLVLERHVGLSPTKRRDLRSAVVRMAKFLDDDPARITLDFPMISAKLDAANPLATGITSKTFANVRSNFIHAVKASGLKPVQHWPNKVPLTPAWANLIGQLADKRSQIGIWRLARYAGGRGIDPRQINDTVINEFMAALREGSLLRRQNFLHRQTALIWNTIAVRLPMLGLHPTSVPSFRRAPTRINWSLLTNAFRQDVEKYLVWGQGQDVFAADARPRALSPATLLTIRDRIHLAVTTLVNSGNDVSSIESLSDLVSVECFRRILRGRHEICDGRENSQNFHMANDLVRLARDWVKTDAATLIELKRLKSKVRAPSGTMTAKNRKILRQFDDPASLQRLQRLPARLWAEAKNDAKRNRYTLAKAQAAIAIAFLTYMPVRMQNLMKLEFGVHLFLRDDAHATSTVEIPSAEVKNDQDLAFDIPPHIAKMLIEYREQLAPQIIGHRPKSIFVTVKGSPKDSQAVGVLIKTYMKRFAGITINPHAFRHLSGKIILDREPGAHELVKQLLGHKKLQTTVSFYTGIDTRRAGQYQARLIEEALADQCIAPSPRKLSRRPTGSGNEY